MIEDEVLLEMYNQILRKIKNNIENEFDSEPVYNEKYLRAKMKSYNEKLTQIITIIKYQKKILNLCVYQ